MKTLSPTREQLETKFPSIDEIIDENTAVINKGANNGIKVGDVFLVFTVEDDESISPVTKQKIGYFEKVKGFGRVIELQNNNAIIQSANSEYLHGSIFNRQIDQTNQPIIPFHELEIGDLAKPIF